MPGTLDHDELVRRLAGEQSPSSAPGEEADTSMARVRAEIKKLEEYARRDPPADPYIEESAYRQAVEKMAQSSAEISRTSAFTALPAPVKEEPLGMLGQYRLLALLGAGGMGTVYKAVHSTLDRAMALKVLSAGRLQNAQSVARFKREMRAVGKLHHPHIVTAHDAGEIEGTHYLAMELIDGINLSALVAQRGPLPIAEACELVRQAALGLAHAHEHGLVHRDIKPSNLMLARPASVTAAPVLKVLDLGLALLDSEEVDAAGELTTSGQLMGTLDYMAPEQAHDTHAVDIRADIYSLGCTLYKLITGEAPYPSPAFSSATQKLIAHVGKPFPELCSKRADVPEELANVLGRMIAKHASDRYATPTEVAAALAPFAAGSDLSLLLTPGDWPKTDVDASGAGGTIPGSVGQTTDDQAGNRSGVQPLAGRSLRRPNRLLWIAAAAAAIVAAAVTIIKVQTRDGTLVLSVDGPQPVVTIDGETAKVALGSEQHTYRVAVEPGTHTLVVTAPDGARYSTDGQFTIEAGGQSRLTARLEAPPPASSASPAATATAAAQATDPDRAAAEWALGIGCGLTVDFDGKNLRPGSVEQLPKADFHVKSLELTKRIIRDDDLARIAHLAHLETLELRETAVTDAGLKHLESLPALRRLSLYFTPITNDGFDSLVKMRNLRELWLRETKMTGAGWLRLKEMPNLTWLSVEALPFTAEDLANVAALPQLRSLSLAAVKVTDAGLIHLSKLKELETLNLMSSAITDSGTANLANISSLHSLVLTGTKITDEGLVPLSRLPRLKSLSVSGTPMTDAGFDSLVKMQSLTILFISATQTTPVGWQRLKELPKLSVLAMNSLPLTDADVMDLADAQPQLLSLFLNSTMVSDASLVHLVRLTGLRNLHLAGTQITDASLAQLKTITKLDYLDLRDTKITPAGIQSLRAALPRCGIEYSPAIASKPPVNVEREAAQWALRVGGGVTVDVAGDMLEVQALDKLPQDSFHVTKLILTKRSVRDLDLARLAGLNHLESLDLNDTGVADAGLKHLEGLPALNHLTLVNAKITDAAFESLAKMRALRKLSLTGTKTTSEGWKQLKNLPRLSELHVAMTPFADADLGQLVVAQPGLETLNLWGTAVTDAGMPQLAKLPQLRMLFLAFTKVTGEGLACLGSLQHLESLYLPVLTSANTVAKTLSGLGTLQSLSIHHESDLTDEGMIYLGKIKSLRELNLPGSDITNAGLADLVGLPQLSSLQLHHPPISDEGAKSLGQLPGLTRLNVRQIMSDKGLESLSRLTKLEEFHFSGEKLTDAGLAHLAKLPNLRLLKCQDVAFSPAGIQALEAALPKCKIEYLARKAGKN